MSAADDIRKLADDAIIRVDATIGVTCDTIDKWVSRPNGPSVSWAQALANVLVTLAEARMILARAALADASLSTSTPEANA